MEPPIDIAGRYGGTAAGMMNTGFGVAGMIAPVAFGFLIQRTGNYQMAFMLSAGLLAIGAISACFIDPNKHVLDPASVQAPPAPAAP